MNTLGKPVADLSLPSTGGGTFRFSDQRGKRLVLCFYPKDNTAGCRAAGAGLRDRHNEFKRLVSVRAALKGPRHAR
ncbi:MAG TPA: redoxin domain-containing protein [Burkholderiales bacterium]